MYIHDQQQNICIGLNRSWDSERSVFSDSEHAPVANMAPIRESGNNTATSYGSIVSTVVRDNDTIPTISGFGSGDIKDLKHKAGDNITAFVGDDESKVLEDEDVKYELEKRETLDMINSIVNDDNPSGDDDENRDDEKEKKVVEDNIQTDEDKSNDKGIDSKASKNVKKDKFKQDNIILEDEEVEDDGMVVIDEHYDSYRPQRLYTVDPEEVMDDDDDDDDMEAEEYSTSVEEDDQMDNQKVVVPIPDYQEISIEQIMNDDIMNGKNKSMGKRRKSIEYPLSSAEEKKNKKENDNLLKNVGYHQFESISGSFDDHELKSIAEQINGINTKNKSPTNDSTMESYMIQTDDEYVTTSDTDTSSKTTQRKMVMLHNINMSLKQTIQQQMTQIKTLKKENTKIRKQFEEYKSMFNDKKGKQSQEDDLLGLNKLNNDSNLDRAKSDGHHLNESKDINKLHRQILSLKDELDKTRHKLLQYEIFDENSELDIHALLNSVDSITDNDEQDDHDHDHDDEKKEANNKNNDKEKSKINEEKKKLKNNNNKRSNWEQIENYIKEGDGSFIDKLIKYTKISMNEKEEINCFKILEAATRFNQIEIVHKIISSYIGVKLGNKLLCYRYDGYSNNYSGYTILMIAVICGNLEIANDLLDYYEYNCVNYNDENKIFEYLNMTDRNGVTLLMKACSSDKVKIVTWVLNQYFNHKIQLKTLIEANDSSNNNIFDGYIQSQTIENVIHEYSPLIN